MDRKTPQTRRGRKYDQVLEGARKVFLKDGYDSANVDEIAREAGVSKATLYSYFPDKRLLFIEITRLECRRQAEEARSFKLPELPPRDLLGKAAEHMVGNLNSPMVISMFRLAAAEASRFPDLAEEFYENGPQLSHALMASYLRAATERGELDVPNPEHAAAQFSELCKAGILPKLLLGIVDSISAAEADMVAREAVETFMARYGLPEDA